jgi:hypothetical protein
MIKKTITSVMPMLSGVGAAAAPTTGPEQPEDTLPTASISWKMLPEPFSGWTSSLIVKLARQPLKSGMK